MKYFQLCSKHACIDKIRASCQNNFKSIHYHHHHFIINIIKSLLNIIKNIIKSIHYRGKQTEVTSNINCKKMLIRLSTYIFFILYMIQYSDCVFLYKFLAGTFIKNWRAYRRHEKREIQCASIKHRVSNVKLYNVTTPANKYISRDRCEVFVLIGTKLFIRA